MKLLEKGRKENLCRRKNKWHFWKIYKAEVVGKVKSSAEETKQANWYSKKDLHSLSKMTKEYLKGRISEKNWKLRPGIKLVWYEWFNELKIIENVEYKHY